MIEERCLISVMKKKNKTTILCVEPFLTSIVKVKVVLRLCCET